MTTVRRLIDFFAPEHYALSLAIDRPARTFTGTVTISGSLKNDTSIWVHAKDLTITSCTVNGNAADFTLGKNDELEIITPLVHGDKAVVVLGFNGVINDQMHGMYPCYFKHDGEAKELIATQFESHHAREVFPCIDEPEAKATFDVTLTTEQGVTVLGNMPVTSQVTEKGQLVTTFDTTPRMSTYLLAWVYGDIHKVSAKTKRGIEVNVWATSAQKPASLEFALDFATRTIDYFEDYFGIDYPLPKSDHVALPDFTSGAMENWGLITYREIALLADPDTSTIDAKHYVAMVVAHELSHQWFGNLVTMKWWDNLWLNESFANFIENLPIHAMHPEWEIWMDYASSWSLAALRRDAIDGVQPVQTEVNHPDEISSLFDGAIVYGKGGRLIGMLREYVGEADFRKGLKAYFTKFQYQNTTGDDLWDCLEEASGKPVREFMNQWIMRAGYPVLHVAENGLMQEQFFIGEHENSDRVWPIPLSPKPSYELPELLDKESLSVAVPVDVRLNVGNWSHFVTHYSDDHFTHLLENMQGYSPLDRLQLINERALLARSGTVSNSTLIPMIQSSVNESNESVWGILSMAFSELKKFTEDDTNSRKKLKKFALLLSESRYKQLGWDKIDGESENDTKLRPLILSMRLYGEDQPTIDEAIQRYRSASSLASNLDPELRSVILIGLTKNDLSESDFTSLVNQYQSSESSAVREDIVAALTATENPLQITQLLDYIMDTAIVRPQDASHWYVYLVRNRVGKATAWEWLRDNWSWIIKTYGGDKSYDDFVRYTAGALSTNAQLNEYTEFFEPMKKEVALTRAITLGISEIKARVELIERDTPAVRLALNEL